MYVRFNNVIDFAKYFIFGNVNFIIFYLKNMNFFIDLDSSLFNFLFVIELYIYFAKVSFKKK